MRKQTKIAAVVSAAALLALGASITSFAAAKGTWMMVDGEWYCYDKNGDAYENTFCSSNGKEYYVGEDGQLVRSAWVEDGSDKYFVNSSGAKITNDWRLTTPFDDDSADEEWYYFQSTGKMAANKKITYKGKTYFFDSEGKMLTGWVTYESTSSNTNSNTNVNEDGEFDKDKSFYCDETGARVEKGWVYTTESGVEEDNADADEYWYYFKSSGKAQTGKATNISGQTYLFDTDGHMLNGWVAYTDSNDDGKPGYIKIGDEDSEYKLKSFDDKDVYFCGDEDDGHAKKNKWIKAWRPSELDEADEDNDQYWYWIDKNGKVYIPSSSDATKVATAYKYKLKDAALEIQNSGNAINVIKKKVNSKDYFFNENGEMVSYFIHVTDAKSSGLVNGVYYFGGENDGSMKTGSQSVKDDNGDTYKFYFENKTGTNKGVGITGNKNGYLYNNGLLITADDYKYQVAEILGKKFIVNSNGSIQHGNVEYKEDGDVLIDTRKVVDKDNNNAVIYNAVTYNNATGATKNCITGGDLRNNVEEIDVNKVMNFNAEN